MGGIVPRSLGATAGPRSPRVRARQATVTLLGSLYFSSTSSLSLSALYECHCFITSSICRNVLSLSSFYHLLSLDLESAKMLFCREFSVNYCSASNCRQLVKQVVPSSGMVRIFELIGILDCAGFGWLLVDQEILALTFVIFKTMLLNRYSFPGLECWIALV